MKLSYAIVPVCLIAFVASAPAPAPAKSSGAAIGVPTTPSNGAPKNANAPGAAAGKKLSVGGKGGKGKKRAN